MAITLLGNSIETPEIVTPLVRIPLTGGGEGTIDSPSSDVLRVSSNTMALGSVYSTNNFMASGVTSELRRQVSASHSSYASGEYSQASCSTGSGNGGQYSQINASRNTLNTSEYCSVWGFGDSPATSNQTIRLESNGGHAFFKGKIRIGEDSIDSPAAQAYQLVVAGSSNTGGSISNTSNLNTVTTLCLRQVNASSDAECLSDYSQVNSSHLCSSNGVYSQVNASSECASSGQWSQVSASILCTASGTFSQVNCSQSSTSTSSVSQVNASNRSHATGSRSQVNNSIDCMAEVLGSQVNASVATSNLTQNSSAWGWGEESSAIQTNQTIRLESQGGHAFFKGNVRIGQNSIVSPSGQNQPLQINGGICQKYAFDDNIYYNNLDSADIFGSINNQINGINIRRVVRINDVTDANFIKDIIRNIPNNKTLTVSVNVSMMRVLPSDSDISTPDDYYEAVFIYSSFFDGVDFGYKTRTVVKTPSFLASSISFDVDGTSNPGYNHIDMEFSGVSAGIVLDYMAIMDITISGRHQA
jgi:hypothetical protein